MDIGNRVNHHGRVTKIENLEFEVLNVTISYHGRERKMKME